jgi:hypothetical protein
MKVKELISELSKINPESQVLIQSNLEEGIILSEVTLRPNGHVGYQGPILMAGDSVDIGQVILSMAGAGWSKYG